MFDKIRNYFRKRKREKHYERCLTIFFETQVRECPHLWVSTISETEYCIREKKYYVKCNPYRCTYILKKLAEFNKEWKKNEK